LWRVSSTRNEEDSYDPVEYAREIANDTVTKSQANADKIRKFQLITSQRNRRAAMQAAVISKKVVKIAPRRQRTQYEIQLAQVSSIVYS